MSRPMNEDVKSPQNDSVSFSFLHTRHLLFKKSEINTHGPQLLEAVLPGGRENLL